MTMVYSANDIADILKVSYETALSFIKYSGITYFKVGKQFRVEQKEFESFIKNYKEV